MMTTLPPIMATIYHSHYIKTDRRHSATGHEQVDPCLPAARASVMTYTSDLHVLIVAADPVERVTIADLVSSQNWSTIMVNDGDAAITHARIEPYDAIVIRSNSTDCEMINCVAEAREKAAPTSPNNATPRCYCW